MKQPEIIELLLTHDERGMEALLLHYGPLMRYVIAPILPDAHDQADCVSEVTVRVWEKIGQFDGGGRSSKRAPSGTSQCLGKALAEGQNAVLPQVLLLTVHGSDSIGARPDRACGRGQTVSPEAAPAQDVGR